MNLNKSLNKNLSMQLKINLLPPIKIFQWIIYIQMLLLANELPLVAIYFGTFYAVLALIFTLSKNGPYQIKLFSYWNWITGIISILTSIIILKEQQLVISNELITGLLFALTPLRLLEAKNNMDRPSSFLLLLGLFLALSKFLFQIDLIFGLYSLISLLFYIYQFLPESFVYQHTQQSFKLLFKMLLYSLPWAILFYILFPYLNLNYKGRSSIGLTSDIGHSGFSGELRPGAISQVILSDQIAFRAEFLDTNDSKIKPLESTQLYWRGQVLDRPLGLFWRPSSTPFKVINSTDYLDALKMMNTHIPNPIIYKVTLEPHQKINLMTLKDTHYIYSDQKIYESAKNDTYSNEEAIESTLVYMGLAYTPAQQPIQPPPIDRSFYTLLNRKSPQIIALIQSLENQAQAKKKSSLSALEKSYKILNYFQKNHFQYTLDLKTNELVTLENFIFNLKNGFCEHYASATALLLRYWNVPSRVVVGYQGGTYNESGRFWTITQKEAHAWVEFLNEKNEWVTLDPTEFAAPQRMDLNSAFNNKLKIFMTSIQWIRQINDLYDYANYSWIKFFIEPDQDQLSNHEFFLKNWVKKLPISWGQFLLITIALSLFNTTYVIRFLFKWMKTFTINQNLSREQILKNKFKRLWMLKSKKIQSDKSPDLSTTHLSPEIHQINELYLKNRFGPNPNLDDYKRLLLLIKQLK